MPRICCTLLILRLSPRLFIKLVDVLPPPLHHRRQLLQLLLAADTCILAQRPAPLCCRA